MIEKIRLANTKIDFLTSILGSGIDLNESREMGLYLVLTEIRDEINNALMNLVKSPLQTGPKDERKNVLPYTLKYGDGNSINMEDLVAQAALLNNAMGSLLNDAARNLQREPLSYPEASGLHNITSTIYYALAENLYREEVEEAEKKERPSFI